MCVDLTFSILWTRADDSDKARNGNKEETHPENKGERKEFKR